MSAFMRDAINSYFILDKKSWRTHQILHIKQEDSTHTGKGGAGGAVVAGEKPLYCAESMNDM